MVEKKEKMEKKKSSKGENKEESEEKEEKIENNTKKKESGEKGEGKESKEKKREGKEKDGEKGGEGGGKGEKGKEKDGEKGGEGGGKGEKGKEKKEVKHPKKSKAIVNGKNIGISTKHGRALCKFIKGKKIEEAVRDLAEVIEKKKPVPMNGEIPHKKGIASGRYPVKASKEMIKLLKQLGANSLVNKLENQYINIAKANKASRPYKRFGRRRRKRTHIYLEAGKKK